MGALLQDLRYALRILTKSPGFTIVAVLTLGLGIGANTVMFSIVNSVLLRPLPYASSERLVKMYSYNAVQDNQDALFQDFLDWRARNHTFEAIAATWQNDANLMGRNGSEKIRDAFATADLFPMMGVQPVLGHLFSPKDDRIGYKPIALLSYAYWQSRWGGDPNVIGMPIAIDGAPYRVAGVLPRGFHYPGATDIWLPMGAAERYLILFHDNRKIRSMDTLGRLRPGVTVEAASADMNVIMGQLAQEHPLTNTDWHVRLRLLQDETVAGSRRSLLILMGAAGLVLLIACANVAGLLMARGSGRAREFAIRGALGGSRSRLVRQMLTEGNLLGIAGGIAGGLLAYAGHATILAIIPRDLPRLDEIHLDARAFAFTFALSLLSAVVFSLVPALSATKIDLQTTLRTGARQAGDANPPMRRLLIAGEMACAMILLLGAGLLLQSFLRLMQVQPGYNSHNLITGSIGYPDADLELKTQVAFARQVIANLKSLPGVVDAAGTSKLPLINFKRITVPVELDGAAADRNRVREINANIVTSGFFSTMQIPLLEGRTFNDEDASHGVSAVVINEAAAREFWPGQNPLGKRLQFNWTTRQNREVIGVVGDVKQSSLALAAGPEVYMPFNDVGYNYLSFVVRTEQDRAPFAKTLVDEIHKVDSNIAVYDLETLDQLAWESIGPNRFYMRLVGAFGLAALALAAIGIYGLISFSVEQRTKEMGVRLALGALPRELLFLIVGQGLRLAAVGLVVGILGALAMGRVFSALLFGVHFTDPVTFLAIGFVLMGVALLACYIPARRAMRVDPIVALRYE